MIVPTYWAEARLRERVAGRTVTIKRFGWSEETQKHAQALAEERARDALKRLKSGVKVERRERKVPYNGAEGVPIREEVLSRHGDVVITRNAYGARCLNSPDVLIGDIDFASKASGVLVMTLIGLFAGSSLVAVITGQVAGSTGCLFVFLAFFVGYLLAQAIHKAVVLLRGGPEGSARRRIARFMKRHPDWHVRVYRTPAGLRTLVLHRRFKPAEPAVGMFFADLGTDPIYVRMCLRQQCFRARVSPKPWRIGIPEHLKPRPGVWPIRPDRMPDRKRWVMRYEEASQGYASCRFEADLGASDVDPEAERVQQLHDTLSKADSDLPIA